MALLTEIYCTVCKKSKLVNYKFNTCEECQRTIAASARTKYLEERAKLTIEERLALIEESLYDLAHQSKSFDSNTPIG